MTKKDLAIEKAPEEGYYFSEDGHLHLLDRKPLTGTSSIGDVLSKPLTWWAAELAAVVALESGEHIPTIREEYELAVAKFGTEKKAAMDALCKKYPIFKSARFAHYDKKNQSATKGTDLHAELEKFVKSEMGIKKYEDTEFVEQIKPFITWSRENVKQWLWSEAHCYDRELWVGGISDAGAELNDGHIAVFDFKSSKEAYITQFIQCAGYTIQITNNGLWSANGSMNKKLDKPIDTLIVVPFGAQEIIPQIRYDIDSYTQGFRNAVGLYRLIGLEKTN